MHITFARRLVEANLDKIKYIFKKSVSNRFNTHLTFDMSSYAEIQANIQYYGDFCDFLFFISPIILKPQFYIPTLQVINSINSYIKAAGRFYIDEEFNIVYSIRCKYADIDRRPMEFVSEVEAGINFYEDVFSILIDVATGRKNFDCCRDHIEKLWGE